MSEFDELLNEVLSQDGNQQLPPGAKDRLSCSAGLQTSLAHSAGGSGQTCREPAPRTCVIRP
jgi:hypothetical protein